MCKIILGGIIMSKYVIARADFGGNTRYVKKFNMTYDINEADRFDTIEDAKDALRHHILTRVDFNLSLRYNFNKSYATLFASCLNVYN